MPNRLFSVKGEGFNPPNYLQVTLQNKDKCTKNLKKFQFNSIPFTG